jgi:hypothetical protein
MDFDAATIEVVLEEGFFVCKMHNIVEKNL